MFIRAIFGCVFTFLFFAGGVFVYCHEALAQSDSGIVGKPSAVRNLVSARKKTSDKLKLTSVAMLDGHWHFAVLDGATGKTHWVRLGVPRPYGGVSVDAYNPDTNTALVSSEYGKFIVVMKEPSADGDIEQKVISADTDVNLVKDQMQQAIDEYSGKKTASTKADVLKLIKPKKKNDENKPRKRNKAASSQKNNSE